MQQRESRKPDLLCTLEAWKAFLAVFIRETVMWIKRSFLWEAVENYGMW